MKQITKREASKLIHSASIILSDAEIENIDYNSGRILDRLLIEKLAECDFVTEQKNIIITGYVGAGKTYLASALANASKGTVLFDALVMIRIEHSTII